MITKMVSTGINNAHATATQTEARTQNANPKNGGGFGDIYNMGYCFIDIVGSLCTGIGNILDQLKQKMKRNNKKPIQILFVQFHMGIISEVVLL